MTTQIPELLFYSNEEYRVAGVNGVNLPTPDYFGLTSKARPTNCYREYVSKYEVVDGYLTIATLAVQPLDSQPINGIEAVYEPDAKPYMHTGGTFTSI